MDKKYLRLISKNEEQTQIIGSFLGSSAQPGDIILLSGNLGSGKTVLTKGIARGLNISDNIQSPTFVLIREYNGKLPLYHIDLYRLDKLEEIYFLGLEQYFDNNGVCVIEWAEKGMLLFPEYHLFISLTYISENQRVLEIQALGARYINIINKLKEEFKQWNYQ